MEKLEYIIESQTIAEVLGVQNFTSEESAMLELVKNSFDAQAKSVYIFISKQQIIVEDDGIGMNRQKILDFWMHVGKSDKNYEIHCQGEHRVLAGAKGIGRFALARLGERVRICSKAEQEIGVVWDTDWNSNILETDTDLDIQGTRIIIKGLRDNWTEFRVRNLCDFLSRTYNDDIMKIYVEYKGRRQEVKKYFGNFRLGIHGVSLIRLYYDSQKRKLTCLIESDEFKEEAIRWCPGIDLHKAIITLDMADELEGRREELTKGEESKERWEQLLTGVGSFSAEFYFSLKNPSTIDADKFCFKYRVLERRYGQGVVLYRNSFSIASYEGKKDWLGLGERSRTSPAPASHATGSWRVKENQISGKVIIDKKENQQLADLANRQGVMENATYKIFIQIILSGIQCFERYRQKIIRSINQKNCIKKQANTRIFDMVVKEPARLSDLSLEERDAFVKELKDMGKKQKESLRQIAETEKRYQYDIRLLNTLATSGLKAASVAHEIYNNRNSLDGNVEYIIRALKQYGLWDFVNEPDKTKYMYSNIPALLEKNQRINKKIITFIDTMLSESEKEQFFPENIRLYDLFQSIKETWEKDYSWVDIRFSLNRTMMYRSAKDIFWVIFDNLILNSIQQNDNKNSLQILIQVRKRERFLHVTYLDNGRGLMPKYLNDPMRILEVHETTRKGGHGIGMWIVNNTVIGSGGTVLRIEGKDGFRMEFLLGGRI